MTAVALARPVTRRLTLVKDPPRIPPAPPLSPTLRRISIPREEIPSDPPPEELSTDREVLNRVANQVSVVYNKIPVLEAGVEKLERGMELVELRLDKGDRRAVRLEDSIEGVQKEVAAVKDRVDVIEHKRGLKTQTPRSGPISIPPEDVDLPTGQYKALLHDKEAAQAFIAAKASALATELVDKRVAEAIEHHDTNKKAKRWDSAVGGTERIVVYVIGGVLLSLVIAIGVALLNQVASSRAQTVTAPH
jgi:hypothetical protein